MKNCDEIESLMMLNRAGERTAAEQALVDAHLADCEVCRAALANTVAFDTAMTETREAVTLKGEAFDGSDAIMKEIHRNASGRQQRTGVGRLDSLLEWFIPALAVPIVALLLLFIVQESTDYSKISANEQRLKATGMGRSGYMAMATPKSTAGVHEVLITAAQYASVDERTLLIRSADIIAGLTRGGVNPPQETANKFTAKRFPAIAALMSGRPVGPDQRRNLLTEGTTLLQEFDVLQRSTKGIQ